MAARFAEHRPSAAVRGATRPLLLVVLGLAVATLGGGLYHLATTDSLRDPGGDGENDEGEVDDVDDDDLRLPSGAGDPGRRRSRTGGEDPEDGGDGDTKTDILEWERDPEGDVFHVNDATLRAVLADRHFEEFRRQIDVLQRDGKVVPSDVVRSLLDMLTNEGLRIDAMLALGQVTDDATGRALAELAADPNAAEATRVAALEALAKSGQAAGLTHVRNLVETATEDTRMTRQALFALAAMGGQDGVAPLVSFLSAHPEDALTDAAVTALAKAKDADAVLAQELRSARDGGDAARLMLLLRVGTQTGSRAGDELRAEVQKIVESPEALAALPEDAEARLEVLSTAISVAAAMGGKSLDAAVRVARDQTGVVRSVALHSMRQARGDEAAAAIATLLDAPSLDARSRREVVAALGSTESRKATPFLHAALDDEEQNVRHEAAAGLGRIRDPASVPVILARLDGAKDDFVLTRHYVEALGTIGVKDAIPALKALRESGTPQAKSLDPFILRAITRIETGNPNATRIR